MRIASSRRGFLALPAGVFAALQGAPRTGDLQKLIDDAEAHGGGTVTIPPGRHSGEGLKAGGAVPSGARGPAA